MIDAATIPQALRDCDQWVCWRVETRGGKPTKVPYNPRTGERASSTNPATWSQCDRCLGAAGYDGIGFVFTVDDPFIGVDLDDCLDDAGQIGDEARSVVADMNTYAEVSPSGRGIKVIGFGCKPGERCKTTKVSGMSAIEVYDSGRFFTITGRKLHTAPSEVGNAQPGIDKHYPVWFPAPPAKPEPRKRGAAIDIADEEVLRLASASKQGDKFARLWSGASDDFGGDASAGDLALCNALAFWTASDPVQMDRMFRASGRMRDKWDEGRGQQTYGAITVARAIDGTSESYLPGKIEDYAWFTAPAGEDSSIDELASLINATIAGRRRATPWKWPVVHGLTRALMPGTLTILCGNPGATKSFLLLESVAHWSGQGIPVACLMLEDTRAYHLQRAIAQHAGNGRLTDSDWIESHPAEAREAMRGHRGFAERVGRCIDCPPIDINPTGETIAAWIEAKSEAGARVVCVDPITLAAPGEKQWVDDHHLIASAKKAAERHECSVVLVTHPKKHPQGKSLDDVSGGAAVTRFAHTVLWLEYLPQPESKLIVGHNAMGLRDRSYVEVNRILRVLKARNGRGTGSEIGMTFHGESLTFTAHGIITKD